MGLAAYRQDRWAAWLTIEESLRRYGLVPSDEALPEVRVLLAKEAEASVASLPVAPAAERHFVGRTQTLGIGATMERWTQSLLVSGAVAVASVAGCSHRPIGPCTAKSCLAAESYCRAPKMCWDPEAFGIGEDSFCRPDGSCEQGLGCVRERNVCASLTGRGREWTWCGAKWPCQDGLRCDASSGRCERPGGESQYLTAPVPETRRTALRYRKHISQARSRIEVLLAAAKSDKMAIKANCLVDKWAQVKATTAMVDQAAGRMDGAIARTDPTNTRNEFARVYLGYRNIGLILAEAELCPDDDQHWFGR